MKRKVWCGEDVNHLKCLASPSSQHCLRKIHLIESQVKGEPLVSTYELSKANGKPMESQLTHKLNLPPRLSPAMTIYSLIGLSFLLPDLTLDSLSFRPPQDPRPPTTNNLLNNTGQASKHRRQHVRSGSSRYLGDLRRHEGRQQRPG